MKGKTYQVKLIHQVKTDELMIIYSDNRLLSEIAADWENAESITYCDSENKETVYEGFSRLKHIVRETGNDIQLYFEKR